MGSGAQGLLAYCSYSNPAQGHGPIVVRVDSSIPNLTVCGDHDIGLAGDLAGFISAPQLLNSEKGLGS